MACDEAHSQCVFPAQLTACNDLNDGDICTFSGAPDLLFRCQDGVCLPAERCGDGILNGVEQCDATDLGGGTCEEFGYYGGTLACTEICSYDLSGCTGRCGNDIAEGEEDCDGLDLAGETCVTLGLDSGDLGCRTDCTFDLRSCVGCGNSVMEAGEQCDGTDLAGLTCQQITGHPDGDLQCTAECQLLTTDCHTCGNATLEGPEVCDDTNLSGETCQSQAGLAEGSLACSPDCLAFDTSDCHLCGNQTIEGPEACDGDNLGGATCSSLAGHLHGQPVCNPDCTFNIADCHTCGNQTIEGPEDCDTDDLGGETCDSLTGHVQGESACNPDCTFDTSDCHTCGNGTTEGPEGCDDGNDNLHDSCPDGLQGTCQPATCGDGFAWTEDGGTEQCDLTDLMSQTCQDFGFVAAPGLNCLAGCLFDTSGCTAVCGNGIVEPGEQCDASALNGVSPEPCKIDCTVTTCGDGYLGGTEQCDAGLQTGVSPEPCKSDCTLTFCGDGYLGGTEQCDAGAQNGVSPEPCMIDCAVTTCGDGYLGGTEQCDAGAQNGISPEPCKSDCSLTTCGDGYLGGSETCDEGSSNANLPNATCRTDCTPKRCGDNIIDDLDGEACDTADLAGQTCSSFGYVDPSGLSCDPSCQFDTAACNAVCGNMVIETTEECDDGTANSDTIPDACRTTCLNAHCGDGVADTGEVCDGNDFAGSTLDCADYGYVDPVGLSCSPTCAFDTTTCNAVCGNMVIEPTEECEDGNFIDNDGCHSNCLMEECAVFVDADPGITTRDGLSWTTAYASVQDGIDDPRASQPGCDVWVAQGVYHVYQTSLYDTIIMRSGVGVYGGFTGSELQRMQRDWQVNTTVLDGTQEGNPTNAACNVVTAVSTTDATLDGFVITGGRAGPNGCAGPTTHERYGGGMYNSGSTLTVANCIFDSNTSGCEAAGMANWGSSVNIDNCIFRNNFATYGGGGVGNFNPATTTVTNSMFELNSALTGGGMLNSVCSPVIRNTLFFNNSSWAVRGGAGMANKNSASPTVINSVFAYNTDSGGGGMHNYQNCYPVVTNCTFYSNTASSGGGLMNENSSPIITNCVIWSNSPESVVDLGSSSAVTYSNVQGGFPGGGNIDATPILLDPANYDFRLQPGSPCIDSADGDAAPEFDIEGNSRFDDPASTNDGTGMCTYVDIGAYACAIG
ncbi:DUF4215 domain-containing protein [Myxococcota bacterium]